MKFILSGLGNWGKGWDLTREAVPLAEKLGFWGAVFPDHYMWGSERGGNSTLDTWIILPYLAALTERIRLGTLVTPIPFRPPGLLAKMVATVDILSKGRVFLGVGAGWSRTEFEGYSEWDDPRTRVEKTKEGLDLILRLMTEEKVDFTGKFYHAKGAVLEPKPVQKPHPPLLFGGFSPRMLRLAGRFADICYIPPWIKIPFSEAKAIVDEAANKYRGGHLLDFAAGSPGLQGKEYNQKDLVNDIEKADRAGCKFYVTPFPSDVDYVATMQKFAMEVMPSFGASHRTGSQREFAV